jgi:GTPase SAR1 family protein
MDEITLRDRADQLFEFALAQTKNSPALRSLHQDLQQCYQKLDLPMRVAVVGKIKAGKSTMMNAILGEALVATGNVEATFNINWLRYAKKQSLQVHFKDHRPPEPKSFEELAAITVRADANRSYLRSIKYIEVFHPNPILQTFDLIDTPGLESFYKDDSDNTIEFLQLHGKELSEITQTETANADAVLYLFSHSTSAQDRDTIQQFQGNTAGRTTPINSVGVLTKADMYWSDEYPNPMDAGRRIAERLATDPQMRNLLYTIVPVCGLPAFGAQTIEPSEFDILTKLANLPEARFDKLIRTIERFTTKNYPDEPDIPAIAERLQVFTRLGQYGIWRGCKLIRAGVTDLAEFTSQLLQESGVQELRNLVKSHFGNRAFLIKLSTGIEQILGSCFRQKQQATADIQVVKEVAGRFERIKAQAHEFQELRVLRSYYENKLDFAAEEVEMLLQVTGEDGSACAKRLGLDERATISEMLPIAESKMNYWRIRANDLMGADSQTIEAARVLAHSYERVLYHVNAAKRHLYF